MHAQFYLLNISFRSEMNTTIEEIENAIKNLSTDINYIKSNGDTLYRHESVYEEVLIPGFTIGDVIRDDSQKCQISRDAKRYLSIIIDRCKSTTWSNNEIIDLILDQNSEDLCNNREVYGLVALLNSDNSIPEIYIVNNKRDWFEFHRYFLGAFPCEEHYFIDECEKCFPNIFFHERIRTSISRMEGGWKNFSKSIVEHLSKLNDLFPKYLYNREGYQRIEALKRFSSECNIKVTPQGNAKDKPHITFNFINNNGINEPICCEPHMKLSSNDDGSNFHYFHNRIYFHEGKNSIQEGKILVGHLGKHIDFS